MSSTQNIPSVVKAERITISHIKLFFDEKFFKKHTLFLCFN